MKNPIKKIMVFAVVLVIYFIAAFTFIINNILN